MTNPEDDVLPAIDELERDDIDELVDWQIEQGHARGDGPTPRPDSQFADTYHLPPEFVAYIHTGNPDATPPSGDSPLPGPLAPIPLHTGPVDWDAVHVHQMRPRAFGFQIGIDRTTVAPGQFDQMRNSGTGPSPEFRAATERARRRQDS